MYRTINFLAFLGCIVWLYIDPSPEPVVVLLLCVAGFFRDEIHGVIGKNLFSLTPRTRLVRDLSHLRYSFFNEELINPRILEDLQGWISDSGDQVVSVNVSKSNKSNRYFGELSVDNQQGEYPLVTSSHGEESFAYQYLGLSFSGVHLLKTWSCGGGSGVFCYIMLVTLSKDSALEFESGKYIKVDRFVIKLVGSIPLGDRYEGEVSYRLGVLSIPACKGMQSLRTRKSRVLVL
jgi:hypothetical protein